MADQPKSQRGANLTQADRERGGKVSAAKQMRDSRGKFAGSKEKRQQRQSSDEKDQEVETASRNGHHQRHE